MGSGLESALRTHFELNRLIHLFKVTVGMLNGFLARIMLHIYNLDCL